jgi:hypothetical protein
METCFRCHAPRPTPPDPPKKPEAPAEPGKPTDWKGVLKKVAFVASVLLNAGFLIKLIPGVGQVWNYVEMVLRLLEKLGS